MALGKSSKFGVAEGLVFERDESKFKTEVQAKANDGEKNNKEAGDTITITVDKKESRSKRVNLLVKPSVHAAATAKCEKLGISLNECLNQFLEKWCVE